jgi:extracellular matrix regulatory protein B
VYLDFGLDQIINANDIIAIIDKKSFETATAMNDLLSRYGDYSIQQPRGTFKSIIITNKHIYFSPFASNTLKKRSQKRTIST